MNCSVPSVRREGDPEDCRLIVARDNAVHSYPTVDGELVVGAAELKEFFRFEDDMIKEIVFLWQLLGCPRVHLFRRSSYDWHNPYEQPEEANEEEVLECYARLRSVGVYQTCIKVHMDEMWHATVKTGLAAPVVWSAAAPGSSEAERGEAPVSSSGVRVACSRMR